MNEEHELEKRTIGGYFATVYFDSYEHRFTIAYNGNGPIVTDYNIVDAEKKFIEAMDMCKAAHEQLNIKQDGK